VSLCRGNATTYHQLQVREAACLEAGFAVAAAAVVDAAAAAAIAAAVADAAAAIADAAAAIADAAAAIADADDAIAGVDAVDSVTMPPTPPNVLQAEPANKNHPEVPTTNCVFLVH
jgi:hypothetical protein